MKLISELSEVIKINFKLLTDLGKVIKARASGLIINGDKERLEVVNKKDDELGYITAKSDTSLTVYKGKDFKVFKKDSNMTNEELADKIINYLKR